MHWHHSRSVSLYIFIYVYVKIAVLVFTTTINILPKSTQIKYHENKLLYRNDTQERKFILSNQYFSVFLFRSNYFSVIYPFESYQPVLRLFVILN